ncbi:hypothetical protein ATF84_11554 [[Clostridium] innocuum]|nr:hypothetical protein ATF84_11554 [[Clostridium] innocuum]SSA47620.1 hypothetical protein SAMN04487929_11554 [[Clostridium] innocuum]
MKKITTFAITFTLTVAAFMTFEIIMVAINL